MVSKRSKRSLRHRFENFHRNRPRMRIPNRFGMNKGSAPTLPNHDTPRLSGLKDGKPARLRKTLRPPAANIEREIILPEAARVTGVLSPYLRNREYASDPCRLR